MLLTVLTTTAARAQNRFAPTAPFPNGGLLGENPFKGGPDTAGGKASERNAWSLKPANAANFARAGWACLGRRDEPEKNEKALAYFCQALLCDPLNVDAHRGRGLALLGQYCYQASLEDLDFVLRREPARDSLYPRRAFLRAMVAEFHDAVALKAAEDDLARPGTTDLDEGATRGTRGIIALKKEHYQKAVDDLSWAIEHGFDHPGIRLYRGLALTKLADFPRAISDFEHILLREPTAVDARNLLATCHARSGRPELALLDYAKVLELEPQNAEALCDHLSMAIETGLHDLGLADLDKLAALYPDYPWIFALRSLIRWTAGKDLARARSDIDRAIQLQPREWIFLAYRAALDCKKAEYAKALGDIARSCLSLRRTKFEFSWNTEEFEDGHGNFILHISWHSEGQDRNPNGDAKHEDLDHRLADLGLKTLWSSHQPATSAN